MNNTFYILIGNIGTGKTAWSKEFICNNKSTDIVCPDKIFEETNSKEETQKQLIKGIENASKIYQNVILDGNCISVKSRRFTLYFKRYFEKTIAVDFGKGDDKSLQRRIKENQEETESFWRKIHFENLIEYEKPELVEGFDEIITIKK